MLKLVQRQRYITLMTKLRFSFPIYQFRLPDLGEKIKEGTIRNFYIKQGDKVKYFDNIACVESDKQTSEITSPCDGIIKKIYYRQAQVIQVGNILIDFQTEVEQIQVKKEQKIQEKGQQNKPVLSQKKNVEKQSDSHDDQVLASSTVHMLSREHKIDLKKLKGTGKKGRILKDDIIYYLQSLTHSKPTDENRKIQGKVSAQYPKKAIQYKVETIKMNKKERALSQLIAESNVIPHLYYQQTFDVTQLKKIVEKSLFQQNNKRNISLFSILIKTFSLALNKYPQINSTYASGSQFAYTIHQNHNLLVPSYSSQHMKFQLLQNIDQFNIFSIQQQLSQHKEISIQQLSSSTILLSNIGEQGIKAMNPVIYGNAVCHANIGALREISTYINHQIHKRYVVDITMGCDHRVLDGATVARFTTEWRQLSQNPTLAFLNMI